MATDSKRPMVRHMSLSKTPIEEYSGTDSKRPMVHHMSLSKTSIEEYSGTDSKRLFVNLTKTKSLTGRSKFQ